MDLDAVVAGDERIGWLCSTEPGGWLKLGRITKNTHISSGSVYRMAQKKRLTLNEYWTLDFPQPAYTRKLHRSLTNVIHVRCYCCYCCVFLLLLRVVCCCVFLFICYYLKVRGFFWATRYYILGQGQVNIETCHPYTQLGSSS